MLIRLKKKSLQALALLISTTLFFSCQKNIDRTTNVQPVTETPDLGTTINSAVSGFVLDENNEAVLGAYVEAGGKNTSTDKYGYFEIKNATVVKTAAVVTVTQPGYFKAIKTYGATANKAAFFRIKLIPKAIAGTVSGTTGGNVTLSNGLIITLPAAAVMIASNSTPYTGAVNVAAYWINPEAVDLTEIMPGDLRGIDAEGLLKGLTTYGMAAVELTSASGELLQIATGKKATITMPLSSLLSSAGPASIPLWYFDETKGLWKQDGSAVKTGNTYVGEVSHFSYWNCDLPNAIVPLTFNVIDANGTPLGGVHVEIVPTTPNSWSHIGGYTDPSGFVSLLVTPNASYTLSIYSDCNWYGGTPNYTQPFSVTTIALDLGNISILAAATAQISGTVTNCGGNPVTNGYIMVSNSGFYSRYNLDNNGTYSFSTVLCNGAMNVNIIAQDNDGAQQSNPAIYTIVPGANNIGNTEACGVSINEYINYTIDAGTIISLSSPTDSLYQDGGGTSLTSYISGNNNSPAPNGFISFSYDNTGIAVGSVQPLLSFYCNQIGDQNTVVSAGVRITEYGAVGAYIAGNFNSTVTTLAGVPHAIYCTFRVRRNF